MTFALGQKSLAFTPGAFQFANNPDWTTIFTFNGLTLHGMGSGLGFVGEENRGGVEGDTGNQFWPPECRDTSIGGIFLTKADPKSVMTHPTRLGPYMGVEPSGFDRSACARYREFDYAISYADAMEAACQYRGDLLPHYGHGGLAP